MAGRCRRSGLCCRGQRVKGSAVPPRGTRPPPPGPARVLVVTDQELLGAVVAFALNHGAYATRVVAAAAAAGAELDAWAPHLAVLDVNVVGRETMARYGYAPD